MSGYIYKKENCAYEYGLNQVYYRLLCLASRGQIIWDSPQLKEISARPAMALRNLVDKGLLDGPGRHEKIASRPFTLSAEAQLILAKIDIGLHHPSWLSAGKIKVLQTLALGYYSDKDLLESGCHRMSILSLRDAGYIHMAGDTWFITNMGLRAWRDYLETKNNER